MGSIIDRALDIINDHLKDQTSSFPDPISIKPMARGGEVLEDKYPTHYLPNVGRQVMADGGAPTFSGRVMKAAPVEESPVESAPQGEGITAYHGTPHKFEKFDTSKIGTGEGAQAYGHGLYFAENPGVAQEYRSRLAGRPEIKGLTIAGHTVGTHNNFDYSPRTNSPYENLRSSLFKHLLLNEDALVADPDKVKDLAVEHLTDRLKDLPDEWPEAVPHAEKLLKDVQRPGGAKLKLGETPGHMYEVRINAGPEHLLDWDKPLNEQHPEIIKKLGWTPDKFAEYRKHQNIADDIMMAELTGKEVPENSDKILDESSKLADKIKSEIGFSPYASGEDVYRKLQSKHGSTWLDPNRSADEALSTKLVESGIRGIRYLDAGSRGKDGQTGSHNIVVFDPKHIEVKRRYAKGGEVPHSDDEGIVAYAFGNSVPHIEQRIAAGEFPEMVDESVPAKAFGGGITPIELNGHNLEDEARRLILWSQAVAPLGRPLARKHGGKVESTLPDIDYPLRVSKKLAKALEPGKKTGKVAVMSPQQYLKHANRLQDTKEDNLLIDAFKKRMKKGEKFKALKLLGHNRADGRHRATAAEELGIKKVPVIDYRESGIDHMKGIHSVGKNAKKAGKVEEELRKERASGGPVTDDADNAVNIARNLTPMGFYSAAAEAASKIPQRAPIDQILNKLKGSPNVKAEELDLSGARNAFAGQKSVDPAQVARHLQSNLPPLQETIYGYDSKNKRRTNVAPRYKQYSFPGGSNYREVLMHLPEDEDYDYQSSHWGEKYDRPAVKNVVAHLRMADRGMYGFGDPEALHIEEVQSDWGQEGRDAGFRQKYKPQSMSQWAKQKYPDRFYDAQNLEQKLSDERFPRLTNDEHELMQEYELSQNEDKSLPVKGPHVTSTEGWTDLALKRALQEAARGKYKRLTWTLGGDQAARYGLDKSYNQIHYSPDTKELYAEGREGFDDVKERVHPDALKSFIGKELAEKLLSSPLSKNTHSHVSGDKVHSLVGGDLAVEQKGMRDYYDRFLPNRLQKLVSKLDPESKVQLYGHRTYVSSEEDPEDGVYYNVHSLEITPKLRAAILKGLPAFEHGGSVASANPAERSSSVLKRAFKVIKNLGG